MLVILFRSKLTAEAGTDYQEMGEQMLQHAKAQPGFVDYKQYTGEDGERLTVVRRKDEATLEQWRNDARHRAAKARGRERWYEHYHIEIARIYHEAKFDRSALEAAATRSRPPPR